MRYIECKPRLLRRGQSRWGFQRGEAAALPFGRTRGFKPRVRYNLISQTVLIALVVAAGPVSEIGAQTLKIATMAPDGTVWMKKMRQAGADIMKKTEGRVKFKFYPGGVMGSDKSVLRKIRIGQLHGGAITSGALAQIHPDSQLYGLPLLFRSYKEVDYVRDRMDEQMVKALEPRGYVAFGVAESGLAYLMSRQPVLSIQNLREQKVWVLEGDVISQTFFEVAGVSPIPLPVSDVHTALQTGLIDTVGTPPIGAIAMQWHTKGKYMTDAPLLYTYGMIVIDRRAFARLSRDDQVTVQEVIARVTKDLNKRNREDNRSAGQALRNFGIKFVIPPKEELANLRRVAAEARKRLGNKGIYTPAVLKTLESHLETYRNKNASGPAGR